MSTDKDRNAKRPEGTANREPPIIDARVLDARTHAPEAVDPVMSQGAPPVEALDLRGLDPGMQDLPAQDAPEGALPEDESHAPAAQDPAPHARMKIAPLLFAVLGGAAIALGGLWFLRGNDDMAGRIADMQRQSEASAAAVDVRLKAADTAMQAIIDKKTKDIEMRLAATQSMLDSQRQIIAALEKRIAEGEAKTIMAGDAPQAVPLASTPDGASPAKPETAPARDAALVSGLDEVSGRLAEIAVHEAETGKRLATLAETTAKTETRLSGLEPKFAPLEAALAAIPARLAPVETALTAIAPRLAPLEAAVAALPERLAPVETALAAINPRLAPLEAALASPKSQSRATETRSEGPGAANNAAAVAVVAQSVLTALDRGVPFASEIAALENLGAEPSILAPLKPLSSKGTPLSALAAQLKGLSSAILKPAVAEPARAQSWAERIGNSAASLVQVSHAGDANGNDAAGLLAQIDTALAQGKSSAALATWDKLPAAAKTASQDWQQALAARTAAADAASSLLAGAIAGLGSKKP